MIALAELQRAAQAYVRAGGGLPALLAGAVREPATERWQIYSDAYRVRIVEALKETFPAFARRVDAATWGALLLGYLDAEPSTHRSLRDYGGGFAAWLAADAADAPGSELHLLAELAAFEWALAAAFVGLSTDAHAHIDRYVAWHDTVMAPTESDDALHGDVDLGARG
jgi:hypothetical protein